MKKGTMTVEKKKIASFKVSTRRKGGHIVTKFRLNFEDGTWYCETGHGWDVSIPAYLVTVGGIARVKMRNKQHIVSIVDVC